MNAPSPAVEPRSQPAGPVQPIVLLTAQGPLSCIVVNGLAERLGPIIVIREQPESKKQILRRRVRLLGVIPAVGQLALQIALRLAPGRQARMQRVWTRLALDPTPDNPSVTTYTVPSVNDPACHALLRELAPAVIGVYSTRLLSRETLACVTAPFVNYHAGITPKYRGQDPGYWALVNGDAENCGVTVHLVDEGVDTGAVLYQAPVTFAPEDRIDTYQTVQAATAIPLFAKALADARDGRLAPHSVDLPSQKWFPPTLWGYLATGVTRGVW